MKFIDMLNQASERNRSMLCVGLDPDVTKFPAHLKQGPDTVFEFCRNIVDATADLVCAFKPQIAYFAALRAEDQLEALCQHIRAKHPQIPIVLDAKRGDIGSTAEQYAREAFERYQAHAVTVNPYMGQDSVAPYLEWQDRGVIVLCRTSNPGGSDLQFLEVAGRPLYQHVAQLVADKWNLNGQCGLVVGATFPQEIAAVRGLVGDMPLLIPGIGAQGGDVAATVRAGRNQHGGGMVINSSRAILYAGTSRPDNDYIAAARNAAKHTQSEINQHL